MLIRSLFLIRRHKNVSYGFEISHTEPFIRLEIAALDPFVPRVNCNQFGLIRMRVGICFGFKQISLELFRIDVSLNIEGNLLKKKLGHSSWMFSIYNITGRRNAYSVYFNNDRGRIQGYKLSIYGEPIFTISYNFKLGNYAVD